ncbi:MAG: hypothetical protein HON47_03845 [Candidatus Diapherotrites archaeon]|jgi:hypothetical protein|uniref:Uncharacterized protein n=1 Tax=Candidatus Iainarchaeum sp. TaxID=3101447 RepID=A0A8T5GFS8_9ARCH|nr:hypothetical protein [Candidatus Diapherotrites archaeon]MBT7241333.1 hypothetical protein [Candidatus Diapherotrites archaeon]
MGFLGKVFGSKEKKEETIETTLELLPTIIEKNFDARKKELEMNTAKKMSEIKFLHIKSLKLLEDIKSKDLEEKENQRFNKAAFTSKKQIEKQLEKLLIKMDPADRGNTLEDVKAFSGEGNAILVNEIMSFRKNIAYTSAYMKDEMKSLGESLQGMLNNFTELAKLLDNESEMFNFEKVKEKILDVQRVGNEIERLNKEIDEIDILIVSKEKEITSVEEKKKETQKGEGMLLLEKLEEEKASLASQKQKLKSEVSSLLSTIDRPLQRFNSLVSSGRWVIDKEKQEILNGMLTNPMLALKKDPSGEKFKEILQEVVKAINDEKIELKEREKEKRLNALNELLTFNFFEKVFWKLNEIQKKQSELEAKLKENTAQKELALEENKIKHAKKTNEELIEKKGKIKREKNELIEQTRKDNDEIITFSEQTLGKKIIIKS